MNIDSRDKIDFGKTDVSTLFIKLFIPTLLSLLFGGLLNLADGIFVGRGVGSDALAAVNVAAPIFMIGTATALLFGSGVSVVAAIHLSHNNIKAANINITQALTVSSFIMCIVAIIIILFPDTIVHLFGGKGRIVNYACDYIFAVAPVLVLTQILTIGMFILRLDGSPKFAMTANIIASLVNIFLDWLFVFPLQLGIRGAAIASSISQFIGALLIISHFVFVHKQLQLYRPKFSKKSILLTIRNVGYMAKIGLSSFIGEIAITIMIIMGNYVFMPLLHEEGVAAFSVACYLFPLVFMFGNAITQSSLPIISYNYGLNNIKKIHRTIRLSISIAIVLGLLMTFGGMATAKIVSGLFIAKNELARQICIEGLPYFSLSYVFFTLNVVLIGFFQGMKRPRQATFFMLLRSCFVLIPMFLILPYVLGVKGLWLAVPSSELITFLTICLYYIFISKKNNIK